MLKLAIAGAFAAGLERPIRHHLNIPCNILVSDEEGIIPLLVDADVLVTMGFTAAMGRAATRLKPPRCFVWVVTAGPILQPKFLGSAERRFSVPA